MSYSYKSITQLMDKHLPSQGCESMLATLDLVHRQHFLALMRYGRHAGQLVSEHFHPEPLRQVLCGHILNFTKRVVVPVQASMWKPTPRELYVGWKRPGGKGPIQTWTKNKHINRINITLNKYLIYWASALYGPHYQRLETCRVVAEVYPA